jgi:GNAT superfamily N-acetyltransferase
MEHKIKRPSQEEVLRVKLLTKRAYAYPYKTGGATTKPKEPEKEAGRTLAAYLGKRMVGAIRYQIRDDDLYFYRLAVLKRWRCRGIGSALVAAAEEVAKAKGCRSVSLFCLIEKKLPIFYAKIGYRRFKRAKFGRFHGVFMKKCL